MLRANGGGNLCAELKRIDPHWLDLGRAFDALKAIRRVFYAIEDGILVNRWMALREWS